jgi:hypothetical protein
LMIIIGVIGTNFLGAKSAARDRVAPSKSTSA